MFLRKHSIISQQKSYIFKRKIIFKRLKKKIWFKYANSLVGNFPPTDRAIQITYSREKRIFKTSLFYVIVFRSLAIKSRRRDWGNQRKGRFSGLLEDSRGQTLSSLYKIWMIYDMMEKDEDTRCLRKKQSFLNYYIFTANTK